MSIVSRSQQAYGGFHPFDIPGCKLWLDAADATTLTLDASTNVLSWLDKSSNARTLTPNAIVSKYDSITKSILFQSNNYFTINPTISAGPNVESMFAVVTFNNVGVPGVTILGNVNTTLGGRNYRLTNAVQQTTASAGTNSNSLASTNTLNSGTKYLLEYFVFGSNAAHYQNGVFNVQGSAHGIFLNVSGSLIGAYGGGGLYSGTMHEILLYDSAPTDAQRQGVEQYLMKKWRVSATSNFNPTSIPGCVLWLDASDQTTIDLSTSPVTGVWRWRDKTSNSNHALRMTTKAPTYVTGGGILFDISAGFASALQTPTTTETGFLVFRSTTPAATQYILSSSNTTGVGGRYIISSNRLDIGYRGTGGRFTTGTINPSSNVTYCFSYKIDGSSNTLKSYFGSQLDMLTLSTVPVATQGSNIIGCRDFGAASTAQSFTGTIYELILYSNALTDSNISAVQNYLIRKWNASDLSAMPVNHTFSNQLPYSIPAYMPLGIPNCILWLDAADSNAIALSGSSNVTTWYDKSGTLSHVSNGTLAQMPTYANNTLTFSGGQYLSNLTAYAITASNHCIFAVHKPTAIDTSAGNTGLINYQNVAAGKYIVFPAMSNTTARGYTSAYGGGNTMTSNTSVMVERSVTTNFNIICANIYASNYGIYKDGSLQTFSGVNGNAGTLSNLYIGSNQTAVSGNYKGDIQEVLVYNNILSDTQRTAVEAYLARKWGLTGNLLAGHIGKTLTLPRTIGFDVREVGPCALWLDAADSTTITLSGSNVTQWLDKSGSSNHASQATTARQPTYSNSAITFVSSNQNYLSLPNGTFFNSPTTSTSIFLVMTPTSTYSLNVYLFQGVVASGVAIGLYLNGTQFADYWQTVGSSTWGSYTTSRTYIHNYVFSSNSLNISSFIDGSGGSSLRGQSTYAVSLTNATLGAEVERGFYSDMVIREVIVYKGFEMSSYQRQQVEGYLASKWGLQTNIPNYHPYKTIKPY